MNKFRKMLTSRYFVGANLREANLRGADLREAKRLGADLEGANIPTIPNLETKVGWKKLFEGNVIELEITGNVVGCYTSTQLRTDRCIPRGSGRSFYDRNFIYEAGNECTSQLNEDPRECCAEGIHFFATREEAERW